MTRKNLGMERFGQMLLLFAGVVVCSCAGLAQSGALAVTPSKVNMLVGETYEFKAVNSAGRSLTNVRWTISSETVGELTPGDLAVVTGSHPGKTTLTAHAAEGEAEAEIEVLAGTSLPPGGIKWSGASFPGCKTAQVVPAPPSASGVDVYEQSSCQNGSYINAYTSGGILVWRRQISGTPEAADSSNMPTSAAEFHGDALDAHAASVCDGVSAGMTKSAVGELLKSRKTEPSLEPGNSWLIEEEGADCRIWFDADARVSKKRKTLTGD